jgi:chorismate dehydratase
MTTKLRVGAVSYLNTKPLIAHLNDLLPEIVLSLDVPSALARDLAAGDLDVGLIPVVEYFRAGDYTIVPGSSIASFGPVMSVKLCSRVPFARIRRVAEDAGSRTSVALLRILLRRLFGVDPASHELPLDQEPIASDADAVLSIGDRAMRKTPSEFPFVLDLGYEWSRWTGLPFVWAVWAVRAGVELDSATLAAFARAKELGRPEIPQLSRAEASRLGLEPSQCEYYLRDCIRHDLGADEFAGLLRFRELAAEEGLIPQGVRCVFHRAKHLVESR